MKISSLGELPLGAPPSGAPASHARSGTHRAQGARAESQPAPDASSVHDTVSAAELAEAVQQANETVKPSATQFEFSIDKDTGQTVVRLLDAETHSVLRQIPSEEMIAIARALDKLKGMLVKAKA